ncbi:hypothetical protein C6496_19200 [Candidatus Poribacteria bacterium]|nr:MAG: hypothetical protein C6496_19200 [Candidatus Poribacteria bacterium]
MNSESKISLIQKAEAQLPTQNFLIFYPPNPDILFTEDEILELTTPILNQVIPHDLSNVQKSQWIKLQIIELLGYQRPSGLRTKQATQYKPKFIHQLLDIFVQSSRNLQVWNYVPYADTTIPGEWNLENKSPYRYKDCRYLLVFHNPQGAILKTTLVNGNILAEWDTTGTQTIKWQASARRSYRNEISSQIIVSPVETLHSKIRTYMQQPLEEKSRFIVQESQNLQSPLIKQPPTPASFLTHNEIAQALRTLIGTRFVNLGPGQERSMGQTLEKEIIRALGYQSYQQTDTGDYPDLLHQLIEVKFQFRDTIDLGKHLPTDPVPVIAPWNKWEISPQEIRYIVALMEQDEQGNFIVDSIVITSGEKFNEYFPISEGTNSKIQIPIPSSIMP